MIGVILWRSRENGNAVIWCEDQGDLAFLDHQSSQIGGAQPYDVGDVVGFDILESENLRSVENVYRLQDRAVPHLAQDLRVGAGLTFPCAANEDNVIAFSQHRLVAT